MNTSRPGTWRPFFDHFGDRTSGIIITLRLAIAIALGLPFLVLHYSLRALGESDKNDWSWFLALLVTTAMICVYYATHTLKILIAQINARLAKPVQPAAASPITILSNRNFVISGLIFGALNCGVGNVLGPPYSKQATLLIILFGYFVAGFVCGLAVWGICCIPKLVKPFARSTDLPFDFTSPDHCGGTAFVGDALIVFGSVTLIVGVTISIYILKTSWTYQNPQWVILLRDGWVVFPYVCSLFVLLAPAVPVHEALQIYKTKQDVQLENELTAIRKKLEDQTTASVDRRELRDEHDFLQNRRKDLHAMRTWPFSLGADAKYLSVFTVTGVGHVATAAEWVNKWVNPR